ncbi:MAG TPA: hypothetical protein VH593_22565 [Ktedonobacteraceae bacterium]|jgi:hypothetical protein
MKKTCSKCCEERDVEQDFSWKNKNRGTRQRWCKFCQAAANKLHYQDNKQIYLDRAHTRNIRVIAENKKQLHAYLFTHPCVDCGCTDLRCLEFDINVFFYFTLAATKREIFQHPAHGVQPGIATHKLAAMLSGAADELLDLVLDADLIEWGK